MATFTLNGHPYHFDGDDDTPLLWVIRESAGLTGTKFGCGGGHCGSCTVLVDGSARRSCVTPVAAISKRKVTTIEGVGGPTADSLHAVQKAWLELDVAQCGYCQAGQIMSVVSLLNTNPDPSDDDINRLHTNICRCGTYTRMRKAIHRAADLAGAEVGK